MDNRGSKSIKVYIYFIVKEQRVDGSSVRYLIVRCTLITNKLV